MEEDQEVAKDGTAVQQKQLPSLPVVPESPSSSKSASNFLPSNSVISSSSSSSNVSFHNSTSITSPLDFQFNFELLRIRSRQLRNSISFNSLLFFTLFALFLFIIVLHLRGSSPHYSSLAFCSNLISAVCCRCFGSRRKRSPSSTRLANGYDPEPLFGAHSSIAARLELEKLFGNGSNGKKNGKNSRGFRRLPTNESEVVEDVDDDDDDEGSDILEDFNPNASLTKNRLV